MSGNSLAFSTGTRVDSAAKHIMACKVDTRLLASVLTRELVRESRIVSLRVIGDDRPGLLANVSAIIGQMGANIIEVAHNRLALDVPAKGAEFDLMIETRDRQHTQEVMDALRERGYVPSEIRIAPFERIGARLFAANVYFSDHSNEEMQASRYQAVTVESVIRFLEQSREHIAQIQVVKLP